MNIEKKILLDTTLILSKKQLYLFFLYQGTGEKIAEEGAEGYMNKLEGSPEWRNFYSVLGGHASYVNELFNLGLLCYFKNLGETIEDKDVYYNYLTLKKHIVKSIELELEELDEKFIGETPEPK
jgi:hypothetical protein